MVRCGTDIWEMLLSFLTACNMAWEPCTFWLVVSHEDADKMTAHGQSPEGLPQVGGSASKVARSQGWNIDGSSWWKAWVPPHVGLSRQLLECLHGIPEQGIQEKPGKSHAVTSATFYRSPRPAVIYCGRRLHKGMGLGSGDHWWPSCRPATTVCLLPNPPPPTMIQVPPTYKI